MSTENVLPSARQLSYAIFQRKSSLLAQLLDAGGDVNAEGDEYERPLLIQAIVQGEDRCARLLIERGASLVAIKGGSQPLTLAARFRNEKICRALLDAGAPTGGCDSSGRTALYEAAALGLPAICRLLVERGADVHEESRYGWLPLNGAIKFGAAAEEIVRILVAAGADPSKVQAQANPGQKEPLSAFQAAVELGFTSHVAYFLDECGQDPHQTTLDGRTMLELTSGPVMRELLLSAMTARELTSALKSELDSQAFTSKSKGFSPL